MKNIKIKGLALLLSLFTLTGCDFMDCDESDNYTKEDVLDSYTRVKQLVTNIYGYLKADFCSIDGAMLDAATDDAIHIYDSSNIQRFVNGTWSANNTVDDQWSNYYTGIRAANLYLAETANLTFDDWKYSDEYENMMKCFNNYKYEVRFLRAYFYFELIRRYHNVPFVTEVLTQEEANQVTPATFETIAQFIVDECSDLANYLPVDYKSFPDAETGRVTKGTALALKARMLLYMASPLYSSDNAENWKKAAKAAYEIIGSSSELGYKLVNYSDLFNDTNNKVAEVILARATGENGDFEKANFPMGVEGGSTSTCPTQNLVDAYEMTDGSAFDWSNPAMKANPYANRDPRMGMTIVYNNMKWPVNNVEIWEGGANGLPIENATTTGYYLQKYVNNSISFESGSKVTAKNHNWILFRYAEVLLNYAEAMVNAFHNPDYKDGELPLSAREAVNQVRARADVNMPELPSGMSESDFVKRLKNERRVELAFEGHRFWDVRRWKDLDETADIYGVKVVKNGDDFEYTKFLLESRAITDNLYFYPIANTERFKNPNLGQNPGW